MEEEKLLHLETLTKELSSKLDQINEREVRKTLVQPILFTIGMLGACLFYIYFPPGLVIILFACFVLSFMYPMLQIPLWVSVGLIVYRIFKNNLLI